MKQRLISATIFTCFFTLLACNKEAGEGGSSSITGKIYRVETNVLGDTLEQYYAADYDVYIMYGQDDSIYDDKFATSLDGSYQFRNLLPGSYTVFAYTRCDLCPSGETAVTRDVEITEKGTSVNLEDIVVFK